MALRIKCRCGKVIQISSKLAGKRLACAGCGWKFSISRERFDAAQPSVQQAAPASTAAISPPSPPTGALPTGELPPVSAGAASNPAGVSPTLPKTPPPVNASDDEPADLDLDSAIADLSGMLTSDVPRNDPDELKLADEEPPNLELEPVATLAEAPSPSAAVDDEAVALSYARDGATRPLPGRTGIKDVVQGPTRTFWADAFHSFVYIFHNINNAVAFVVVCFISLTQIPLAWAGCLGTVGIFIITGWLAALYLSVVQETAVGSEDFPGIKMEEGFIDDIIKPMIKYISAFACALAPAAVYTILLYAGVLPDWMESGVALAGWLALGFFLLPVFILLFAFNALDMIYRLDLIITTVYRTLTAYLAIWLMLLLVGISWTLPLVVTLIAELGLNISLPSLPFGGLGFDAFTNVLDVYLTIVAMRLIGLYYLHFKRRFTLVFE